MLRTLRPVDALLRAFGRKDPVVLLDIQGTVKPGSFHKLCVFAGYDRDCLIDYHVIYYLRKLHELGCEIVFVSTAEGINPRETEKIRPFCRRVIVRENIGYDFGPWKVGLEYVDDVKRFSCVILANDSVYGPLQDLRQVFSQMETTNADFWGITDSWRYQHHLQSYFLVFRTRALHSKEFQEFWTNLPYYVFKHSVILNCAGRCSARSFWPPLPS